MPWHRSTGYSLSQFEWWNLLSMCLTDTASMHTTAQQTKYIGLELVYHLLWLVIHRKVTGTLSDEEITAWEAQARDHIGQVSMLRVFFCFPGHSYEMRRLYRWGNNARIKSNSLFEARFFSPFQLWETQLLQHTELLSRYSAWRFSRGYHTWSIRPGCTTCISSDHR